MSSTVESTSTKMRKQTIAWLVAVCLVVIAVSATVVGALWYRAQQIVVAPEPAVQSQPAVLTAASPSLDDAALSARVAEIMAGAVGDQRLGVLHASVGNGATGTVLWEQRLHELAVPASSMKVLTGAAALLQLPHEARITTEVRRYGQGNDVILVGAGDTTLSRQGAGFYTDAGSIAELAEQVAQAMPEGVGKVYVDNALFPQTFHDSWDKAGLKEGYVAPVTAVALDGGRIDPSRDVTPRQAEPAEEVGKALAAALGATAAGIAETPAAADAEVVGRVQSAPLLTRVRDMMQYSDNVLAEAIGREVALARGEQPTFAGAAKAVTDVLAEHGLAPQGAVIVDSSGLSTDNRLSAAHLTAVLQAAVRPSTSESEQAANEQMEPEEQERADGTTARLRPLLDTLPVGGVSGTLAERYGENPGAGWVRAKTGTLDGTSALAGYVVTNSGEVLTFVLLSNKASILPARAAADAVAGQLSQIS